MGGKAGEFVGNIVDPRTGKVNLFGLVAPQVREDFARVRSAQRMESDLIGLRMRAADQELAEAPIQNLIRLAATAEDKEPSQKRAIAKFAGSTMFGPAAKEAKSRGEGRIAALHAGAEAGLAAEAFVGGSEEQVQGLKDRLTALKGMSAQLGIPAEFVDIFGGDVFKAAPQLVAARAGVEAAREKQKFIQDTNQQRADQSFASRLAVEQFKSFAGPQEIDRMVPDPRTGLLVPFGKETIQPGQGRIRKGFDLAVQARKELLQQMDSARNNARAAVGRGNDNLFEPGSSISIEDLAARKRGGDRAAALSQKFAPELAAQISMMESLGPVQGNPIAVGTPEEMALQIFDRLLMLRELQAQGLLHHIGDINDQGTYGPLVSDYIKQAGAGDREDAIRAELSNIILTFDSRGGQER